MRIARTLGEVPPAPDGRILAIGNFDGVHRGHRAIVGAAVARAREMGIECAVLTFHPHPVTVLRPDHPHDMLTTFEDKADQFRLLGVDRVICLNFDPAFAAQTPHRFAKAVLAPLAAREIYVGANYKFGVNQSGHVDTLEELGRTHGFAVHPQTTYTLDGERVSSSRTRAALKAGDVARAAELLGRPYAVKGLVVAGAARGRGLGYPTANLELPEELVPADGVYAARVAVWDAIGPDAAPSAPKPAIVYIGTRPTFDGTGRLIEVHLLDETLNLYGHRIRVDFVERVRGEMGFAGPDALTAQIARDVARARQVLAREAGMGAA
ncbi:MAG: bifunctional riboflavin kinase/FAD synthetase [Nitrospirae bacterium]|nr:bifunctional riboflavin kinase/FAD synthetase [Nitrospirota bacterium]